MLHPCQTVWAVGQLEDGDIVTAGSDGRVRIWTTDDARQAPNELQEVRPLNLDRWADERHMKLKYRKR
jgi:phospholipase A-2-activating protein